jgi:adenylate cyclase
VFTGSGDANSWSQRALIPYRGPAVAPDGVTTLYESFSFVKLLAARQQQLDDEAPDLDLSRFRGATVVIGLTAAGLHDVYQSPFGSTGKMSGPMVQASIIDHVVSRRSLRPWPRWAGVLAAVAAGLVAAGVLLTAPLRVSLPALAVVAGLATWASVRAFAAGHWVPMAESGLSLVLAAFAGVAWQFFVEGREKRAVKRLFSRYLSRDVYEQVLKNPALAELGGNRREMSVLFSDIRGFTAMTEKGQPEDIVAMLNQYFSRMVDLVFAHRGTLDKFVGDMVMALYGAPLDDPDHADHAVQTALAMVEELHRLNREWAATGRPPMDIGIGINSGEMIAGNIGAESIRSYTVIGDNVNLGSRLESLNKDYGTRIIVSRYTVDRLKGRYDLEPLGAVRVKGKTTSVDIYEVRGYAAPPEAR